jgi:hypothetical protein
MFSRGTISISMRQCTQTIHSLPHHPSNPLSADQILLTGPMSHTPVPTASSSSNFRSILDDALNNYKRKTKNDLLAHQLTAQLQYCDSPAAILDVLNSKYDIQQFIQSQSGSGSSKQWLNSTVTVLCAFSAALGEGTSMASLQRLSRQEYAL